MDNFLALMQSLDALFPIGGYTLSNGMETYVRLGLVHDKESLDRHLDAYLYMQEFNELAFAAHASEGCDIAELDRLCTAAKAPSELRTASKKQCARFLKIHTGISEYPLLREYMRLVKSGECAGHYSIAVGLFIRETGINPETALEMYCYSIMSAMVNHAVKLVPLGQLDGQKSLFRILEKIPRAVKRAQNTSWEELGASGCGFDIRSMQHERLYTRLYIT